MDTDPDPGGPKTCGSGSATLRGTRSKLSAMSNIIYVQFIYRTSFSPVRVLDEEWEAEQHFVPGGDAEAGDIARRQLGAQP